MGEFRIRLDLPDGAQLTRVTVWYADSTFDAALHFVVYGGPDFVADPDATFLPGYIPGMRAESQTRFPEPEQPWSVELEPTSPVIIDNAQHAYALAAVFDQCPTEDELGPRLALMDVRVDYTIR